MSLLTQFYGSKVKKYNSLRIYFLYAKMIPTILQQLRQLEKFKKNVDVIKFYKVGLLCHKRLLLGKTQYEGQQ